MLERTIKYNSMQACHIIKNTNNNSSNFFHYIYLSQIVNTKLNKKFNKITKFNLQLKVKIYSNKTVKSLNKKAL
jgi:hypothetical protein